MYYYFTSEYKPKEAWVKERRTRQGRTDKLTTGCFIKVVSSIIGCRISENPTCSILKWKVSLGQGKVKNSFKNPFSIGESILHWWKICSTEWKFLAPRPLFLTPSICTSGLYLCKCQADTLQSYASLSTRKPQGQRSPQCDPKSTGGQVMTACNLSEPKQNWSLQQWRRQDQWPKEWKQRKTTDL